MKNSDEAIIAFGPSCQNIYKKKKNKQNSVFP